MRKFLAVAFATTCISTPALADLTAEEVLADHMNLISGFGLLEMEATAFSPTETGLTVQSFVGSFENDETEVTINMDGVELLENADNSVSVIYPPETRVAITSRSDEDENQLSYTIATEDLRHVVSGSPGNIVHSIVFAQLAIDDISISPEPEDGALNEFLLVLKEGALQIGLDGESQKADYSLDSFELTAKGLAPTEINLDTPGANYNTDEIGEFDGAILLSDLNGNFAFSQDDLTNITLDNKIGFLSFAQTSVVPDDGGNIGFSATANEFDFNLNASFDLETLEDDFGQALRDGQNLDVSFAVKSYTNTTQVATPEGTMESSSSAESGDFALSLDAAGIRLISNGGASDTEIAMPGMPFDVVKITSAGSEMKFQMPALPSEDRQPFALYVRADDTTIGEAVWSLFDPAGQIPRGPITLEIDITGDTLVAEDFWQDEGDYPFRETQAYLNSLSLNAAGLSLAGDGKITDLSQTSDAPVGEGELNMEIAGLNTLMDTLVNMGLLPEDQAMGARMMLALFTRPNGEDNLVSKLEIKPDGSILANGQRIK